MTIEQSSRVRQIVEQSKNRLCSHDELSELRSVEQAYLIKTEKRLADILATDSSIKEYIDYLRKERNRIRKQLNLDEIIG